MNGPKELLDISFGLLFNLGTSLLLLRAHVLLAYLSVRECSLSSFAGLFARTGRLHRVGKFRGLADGIVGDAEQSRFIELANRLATLDAKALEMINPIADAVALESTKADSKGIF